MIALGFGLSFVTRMRAWWTSTAYLAIDAATGESASPAAILNFAENRYAG
ncbi:hypothetical protein [Martelella limonii]|nr:hypothetical protein [Martelella limonii]